MPVLHRLEGHAGRVAALGTAYGGHADALAPGGQLLGRRGPERVGRAEHHLLVLGDQHAGELADRGGLAGAVDADHSTTAGLPSRRSTASERSRVGSTRVTSSSRRMSCTDAEEAPSTWTRVRSRSTSSWVGATPTSAVIRVSSISSQVSSSMTSRESSASRPRPERALRAGEPLPQPDQPARRRLRGLERPLERGGAAAVLGQVGVVDGAGRGVPRGLRVVADLRLAGRLGAAVGVRSRRRNRVVTSPTTTADEQDGDADDQVRVLRPRGSSHHTGGRPWLERAAQWCCFSAGAGVVLRLVALVVEGRQQAARPCASRRRPRGRCGTSSPRCG